MAWFWSDKQIKNGAEGVRHLSLMARWGYLFFNSRQNVIVNRKLFIAQITVDGLATNLWTLAFK